MSSDCVPAAAGPVLRAGDRPHLTPPRAAAGGERVGGAFVAAPAAALEEVA